MDASINVPGYNLQCTRSDFKGNEKDDVKCTGGYEAAANQEIECDVRARMNASSIHAQCDELGGVPDNGDGYLVSPIRQSIRSALEEEWVAHH
jgi:hypothetical protein